MKPQQLALEKLTVRFETPLGQQAQADWAYCGRHPDADGTPVPVYVFVLVLSFSRMLFVSFTRSMNLASLIGCHQQAFEFLGGWPHSILYDNMKQVKLSPAPLDSDFFFVFFCLKSVGKGAQANSATLVGLSDYFLIYSVNGTFHLLQTPDILICY